jgi:hypothetical protein
VVLQHPREEHTAIGTARMACLALAGSQIHVGACFDEDPSVLALLSDPERPAILLFPSPGARPASDFQADRTTLVVVDGTWAHAKKMIRVNRCLDALPRVAFQPATPSEYRIRKEPHDSFVSTIEAISIVLGELEGDPERYSALRTPFRAMIDRQIDFEKTLAVSRHHRKRTATAPRLPASLRERSGDLVVIAGEANAWPYKSGARHPDELVQLVAHRVGTGEVFSGILAPREPLCPATPTHTQLAESVLLAGEPVAPFLERWNAFVRPTDILCSWGMYTPRLLREMGGAPGGAVIDIRQASAHYLRSKVSAVDVLAERLGVAIGPALAPGRGGLRQAQLAAVVTGLVAAAAAGG